jgi:hypothetical protein
MARGTERGEVGSEAREEETPEREGEMGREPVPGRGPDVPLGEVMGEVGWLRWPSTAFAQFSTSDVRCGSVVLMELRNASTSSTVSCFRGKGMPPCVSCSSWRSWCGVKRGESMRGTGMGTRVVLE